MRGDAEGGDAVVPLEFAHHDGGEEPRVDIAAAQDEPDALALKSLGLRQHGREPGRAGALGHRALQGGIGVDGALDRRLVDEDDVRDEVAHDGQRLCARPF